jgi:hypothetical protein
MSGDNIFVEVFSDVRDKISLFKFKELKKSCENIESAATQGKVKSLFVCYFLPSLNLMKNS